MKNQKTQAFWAVGLILALAVGAYAYSGWLNQNSYSTDSTATPTATAIASPSPTATATSTASPSPSASPTAASKYKTLKSGFGFSLEYPKAWAFSKQESCEGLCHASYAVLTSSKEDNVFNQDFTSIAVTSYPKGEYTLELVSKGEGEDTTRTRANLTDVTIGTKSYKAKRYDDAGGMYGFLVTYLVFENDLEIHMGAYQDDPKAAPSADFQHMLDTFTFN